MFKILAFVILCWGLSFPGSFYYLPDSVIVPSGIKYRVLDDRGTVKIIETDKPVDLLEPHPDTWANGQPLVDPGVLAQWEDGYKPERDSALAGKAVTAQAILSASPKIKTDPVLLYKLQLLAEAVQYTAQDTTNMTAQAVQNTLDILNHPAIKSQPALRDAIKRTMEEVIQKTDGSIDP